MFAGPSLSGSMWIGGRVLSRILVFLLVSRCKCNPGLGHHNVCLIRAKHFQTRSKMGQTSGQHMRIDRADEAISKQSSPHPGVRSLNLAQRHANLKIQVVPHTVTHMGVAQS